MSWIETLPDYLKQNISTVIQRLPESQQVFEQLYDHLNTNKRQKPNPSKTGKDAGTPETAGVAKPVAAPSFHLKLTAPINASEVIFQLEQISFQSPIRKKLNLTFHLLMEPNAPPEPILSILNPATQVPEISVHQFQELIKLCMIIPILGSLMTSKKKLAMLCIWLNDASDPIICQLNFDLIKTQLIDAGKIPPPEPKQKKEKKKKQEVKAETGAESESGSESESETESESDTDPVHDAIIDFFQRQFQLCGILLVNYVPSSNPLASVNKNVLNLNQDSGISITSNGISDSFVMVEAYKGSKAGSLLFFSARC